MLDQLSRVGKTSLIFAIVAAALLIHQIILSSAHLNQVVAADGLAKIPVVGKRAAPSNGIAPDRGLPSAEIISGVAQSTEFTIADEMTRALSGKAGAREVAPRVIAVAGDGGMQNIRDLITLPGVRVAIAPSALLDRVRSSGEFGDIQNKLVYIAPLFVEEFHLLAVPTIHDIRDLSGKIINLGQKGSPSAVLGHEILDRMDIKVSALNIDLDAALDEMRLGLISATLLVSGKPVTSLTNPRKMEGLHLVAVPYWHDQDDTLLPAELQHEDYPHLIEAGDSIDTIGVNAVLFTYNWSPGTEGFNLLRTFTKILASRLPELQTEAHPKWRDVNLGATLPGWERFNSAHTDEEGIGAGSREPARSLHHEKGSNLGSAFLGWILFGSDRWKKHKRTEVGSHSHIKCVGPRCVTHHESARRSH
jgi:TRAP-type uncharacterized transport system substrate-binding protein